MEIIFDRRLIALDQNITSASQVIELSGTLLARQQICRPEYITAMLDVYKDFGPAIVIDSGLAMPHARPEKGPSAPVFFNHHPPAASLWSRGV